MNDLIRPALYEGHHEIVPLDQADRRRLRQGRRRRPDLRERRLLLPGPRTARLPARRHRRPDVSAGAYGFAMASNYNSRPLPAEILVDGDDGNASSASARRSMI